MKIIRDVEPDEYTIQLKEEGYKEIGSGLFGTAYVKSGENRVLKVFEGDNSYLQFIQRVKNLKNPYFPKVYSITKFVYNGAIWYAVELERLKHIEDIPTSEQEELLDSFPNIDVEEYFCNGSCNSEYIEFSDLIHDFVASGNRKLDRAIEIIDELFNDGVGEIDLHGRNVMVRREPQGNRLVFTDPLYNGNCRGGSCSHSF